MCIAGIYLFSIPFSARIFLYVILLLEYLHKSDPSLCFLSFVKGQKPGRRTGFDIDDADLAEMEQCNGIVVASAIFGNAVCFFKELFVA